MLCIYPSYSFMLDIYTEMQFLFCSLLENRMMTTDIFKVVSDNFEAHGIKWKDIYAFCIDRVPAMLDCKFGFHA